MGIGIISNFDVNTSANIDSRLGPYATLAEVTTAIPALSRYVGLTVSVTESGSPVEYWFSPGITDADLVLKNTGGTVNATGLITTGSSTAIQAITGSLIISSSTADGVVISSIGSPTIGSLLYSASGSNGAVTRLDYYEGAYEPTTSNPVNITRIDINDAQYYPTPAPVTNVEYSLIGNTITVWGKMTIEATASEIDATFEMSLPVSPDAPSAYQMSGTLVSYRVDKYPESGTINLVVANSTALIHVVQAVAGKPGLDYWFSFTYKRAPRI